MSIQNNSLFYNSDDSIDITWSPELSDEVNSTIDISIYELQETSDGTLIRKEIAVLASDLPNNGEATLTIPELNVRSKRVIGFIAGLVIIGVKVASVGRLWGRVWGLYILVQWSLYFMIHLTCGIQSALSGLLQNQPVLVLLFLIVLKDQLPVL